MRPTILFMTLFVLAILAIVAFLLVVPSDLSTDRVEGRPHRGSPSTEPIVGDFARDDSDVARKDLTTRKEAANRPPPEGPVIAGTVTDRLTGDPILFNLRAELWEGDRESGAVEQIEFDRLWTDDKGNFAIPIARLWLRADARYTLVFENSNYVIYALENLTIPPSEGRTGLDVRLEPKGHLELVCHAFKKKETSDLVINLTCATRTRAEIFWQNPPHLRGAGFNKEIGEPTINHRVGGGFGRNGPVDPCDTWTTTRDLEPGLWTLAAAIGNQRFETDLTIVAGRSTRVELHRHDIVPALRIAGSMTYTDGVPIAGAELIFSARSLSPGQVSGGENFRYTTDGEGRFEPLDLLPGKWRITAYLDDGATPFLPDLVIPLDPPQPYRLDLVVHRGSVRATLCEQTTGLPFETDYTRWFIIIRNCATGEIVADHGNRFGSAFTIACVPAGRHQIEVRARGFVDFISAPFILAAGQELDLGEIGITRQGAFGSLLLTLTDGDGEPFRRRVEIEVLKNLGLPNRWQTLPWGEKGCSWEWLGWHSYRLSRLPAERLAVRIKEDKKILIETTITIEAGEETARTLSLEDV